MSQCCIEVYIQRMSKFLRVLSLAVLISVAILGDESNAALPPLFSTFINHNPSAFILHEVQEEFEFVSILLEYYSISLKSFIGHRARTNKEWKVNKYSTSQTYGSPAHPIFCFGKGNVFTYHSDFDFRKLPFRSLISELSILRRIWYFVNRPENKIENYSIRL